MMLLCVSNASVRSGPQQLQVSVPAGAISAGSAQTWRLDQTDELWENRQTQKCADAGDEASPLQTRGQVCWNCTTVPTKRPL